MNAKHLLIAAALALPVTSVAASNIRIATDATYPPFESITPDGKLIGFEIELADALCKEMQAQCAVSNQPWDSLIPMLKVGKADALITSMNITEKRLQSLDFSKPYYYMLNRFVARAGTSNEVTVEKLKGKTIAVQKGTPQEAFVTKQYGDVAKVLTYVDANDTLQELVNGRADYTFGNTVQLQKGFLDTPQGKGFAFVGASFDGRDKACAPCALLGEGVAVAVSKGNTALAERFSKAIAAVKQKGIFKQIADRYFPSGLIGE